MLSLSIEIHSLEVYLMVMWTYFFCGIRSEPS